MVSRVTHVTNCSYSYPISINDFTHILLVHVKTTMQIVPFLAKLLWDKRIVNFLINLLWSRNRYHQFWIKIYAIFEKVLHPLSWDGQVRGYMKGKEIFTEIRRKKNIPQGRALWNRDNTTSVIKWKLYGHSRQTQVNYYKFGCINTKFILVVKFMIPGVTFGTREKKDLR